MATPGVTRDQLETAGASPPAAAWDLVTVAREVLWDLTALLDGAAEDVRQDHPYEPRQHLRERP